MRCHHTKTFSSAVLTSCQPAKLPVSSPVQEDGQGKERGGASRTSSPPISPSKEHRADEGQGLILLTSRGQQAFKRSRSGPALSVWFEFCLTLQTNSKELLGGNAAEYRFT